MELTVKRLSKLAGVSVRTLHFYDEIGLLRPGRVGANGYRYYGQAALLRLQQIMFYKELGLSLEEIAEVLDQPGFDVATALEAHRRALEQRLGRLRRLIATVDRTLAYLKGDTTVDNQELFAAFSDEQQAEYEVEAEARWGQSVRDSSRKWKAYSAAQKAQIKAEGKTIYRDLLSQLDALPGSPAVQANIARWHQHLHYFFEPSTEVLRGLGALYNDDPQFNATFQKIDPKLAPFMRAAIEAYCQT
jgi:MerR family transcriptional regulator, thiopeptide resistance regulator